MEELIVALLILNSERVTWIIDQCTISDNRFINQIETEVDLEEEIRKENQALLQLGHSNLALEWLSCRSALLVLSSSSGIESIR